MYASVSYRHRWWFYFLLLCERRSIVSDSLQPHGLYSPWNSPGQNTGVGNLSLLQVIFPTQGLNPGLLHCRQILSQLSHKGSPRRLAWVDCCFSSGSSWLRNQTGVFCIAGGFFTNWATREALISVSSATKWVTIIQSSSDTNYPELASDSRFKGSVPQPCLYFRYQSQVTHTSVGGSHNPTPSSGLIIG